jgi:hypothetical protein
LTIFPKRQIPSNHIQNVQPSSRARVRAGLQGCVTQISRFDVAFG